jgi:omega-6 fatty acid desaturase (delta-12 desaturase)
MATPFPFDWQTAIAPFRGGSTAKSAWQLGSTVAAAIALLALAYVLQAIHWAWTLPVTIALAGCFVRIFVLHHDCGHGSFFLTRRANDITGTILGWFVFTPYRAWRRQHAIHHSTAGDLARRGTGDIWTLTRREYEDATRWRRLAYRLARNPFVLCIGGGVAYFMAIHRVPLSRVWSCQLDRADVRDILVANLAGAAIVVGIFWVSPFLLLAVYAPAAALAAAFGVFLFYVQHQFENVYWREHGDWGFEHGAVDGSSYLELTGVLRWVTASIGVHHVHHLAPTIPNYNLTRCAEAVPELTARVTRLTAWSALRTFRLKLYDQETRELITFAEHRRRRLA